MVKQNTSGNKVSITNATSKTEPPAPSKAALSWIDLQTKTSKPLAPRILSPKFKPGFLLNLRPHLLRNSTVLFTISPCLLEEEDAKLKLFMSWQLSFESALADGGVIVDPIDLRLLMALGAIQPDNYPLPSFRSAEKALPSGSLIIEAVNTGRMFLYETKENISLGVTIKAELVWQESSSGILSPTISTLPSNSIILATSYPYVYVNKENGTIGLIDDMDLGTDILSWLSCPPVPKESGASFRAALRSARITSKGLEAFKSDGENLYQEEDMPLPLVNIVITRGINSPAVPIKIRGTKSSSRTWPSQTFNTNDSIKNVPTALKFNINENNIIIDATALTKSGSQRSVSSDLDTIILYPEFIYGNTRVRYETEGQDVSQGESSKLRILRAPHFEKMMIQRLESLGLEYHKARKTPPQGPQSKFGVFRKTSASFMESYEFWIKILNELREGESEGDWSIDLQPEDLLTVKRPQEMFAEIIEYTPDKVDVEADSSTDSRSNIEAGELFECDQQIRWFEGNLGIIIDGKRYNLTSILTAIMESKTELFLRVTASNRREVIFQLEGQLICLDGERLKQIMTTLKELSSTKRRSRGFKMTDFAALEMKEALEKCVSTWDTAEGITNLKRRLGSINNHVNLSEPDGFLGSLRAYQRDGFSWISSLVDGNLSGLLADDMGLGKTVQLIALLLRERSEGRNAPNLVVCPKSVAPNWAAELARFAPELVVKQLIGDGRVANISDLPKADVYITTYPLIQRDIGVLRQISLNIAIFDEAQNIKNPVTRTYSLCLALKARTKIPVSGTPMENHLGELWAHFNLMMPGFLGTRSYFKKTYQELIEKRGIEEVRLRLAQRIKPFLLRRTKSDVLIELPPINQIIHRCQFERDQRDLYETVRQMTEKKVKDALRNKGAERAHIEFLDALLKLRQVCCDPKLVKLSAARKVKESAKLEALIQLVNTSISEGRSIIIFSQFTTMLALIERALQKQRHSYTVLTGETADRSTPIQIFQEGDVPIILMSLKAGGVGLNLTRADTVILYDPWWNPAVEEQAISRAHRMGQKSSVFVYRLIVQGTVEDRILQLQDKKRDLVAKMLMNGDKPTALTSELIDALFGPLDLDMAA